MKKELEQALQSEFSFMRNSHEEVRPYNYKTLRNYVGTDFSKNHPHYNSYSTYEKYGCECEEGWAPLLRKLCLEISEAYSKKELPVDIIIDQIKEKWGTLRFYFHFKGHDQAIHAFDSMGGGGIRLMPSSDLEIHAEVSDIVRKFEKASASICEQCGNNQASLRQDLGFRVQTLCSDCHNIKKHRHEIKKRIIEERENKEALDYLYDEILSNSTEEEAGEAFDGYDV